MGEQHSEPSSGATVSGGGASSARDEMLRIVRTCISNMIQTNRLLPVKSASDFEELVEKTFAKVQEHIRQTRALHAASSSAPPPVDPQQTVIAALLRKIDQMAQSKSSSHPMPPSAALQPLHPPSAALPQAVSPVVSAVSSATSSPTPAQLKKNKRAAPKPPKVTKPPKRIKQKHPALNAVAAEVADMRIIGRHLIPIPNIPQVIDNLDAACVVLDGNECLQMTARDQQLLRRTKRRLEIRRLRLANCIPFDIDTVINEDIKKPIAPHIVDYQQFEQDVFAMTHGDLLSGVPFPYSFQRRLLGDDACLHKLTDNDDTIVSKYSGKKLAPFYFRDFYNKPPAMILLHDIIALGKYRGQCPDADDDSRPNSIDYVPFQPSHLQSVNELLCRHFWPGINMKSELAHPEHTVVATFGRRVVGCAFLDSYSHTSQGYLSYIAVDAGWSHAGIGKTMLYFLLKSVENKDVLLHVSAMNASAMMMYQKFGFKGEGFQVGFYDKYIQWTEGDKPDEKTDRGRRNAIVMRLRR